MKNYNSDPPNNSNKQYSKNFASSRKTTSKKRRKRSKEEENSNPRRKRTTKKKKSVMIIMGKLFKSATRPGIIWFRVASLAKHLLRFKNLTKRRRISHQLLLNMIVRIRKLPSHPQQKEAKFSLQIFVLCFRKPLLRRG